MDMPPRVSKKVNQFFSKYPLKHYDKGEILILADEAPQFIYYITKGFVRQYDVSTSGDEIVVNVFKPPAFFPLSWAVAQVSNRYFFDAGSKVSVHQVPPEDALAFLKDNPDVMLDLLARLYRGVDGMQRRMAHLMGGNAKTRLIYELILEAKRFGNKQKDGSILIKINETELGSRAGLSRETISREVKYLRDTNLIKVSRQGILLKSIEELEQKLGSNL